MRSVLAIVAAAMLIAIPGSTRAQVIQQSGRALDANLRIGSGGYNSRQQADRGMRSPIERTPYNVQRGLGHDYYNVFVRERLYTPNRETRASQRHKRVEDYRPSAGGRSTQAYAPGWDSGYDPGEVAALPEQPPPASARHQLDVISYAIGYELAREIMAGLAQDDVGVDETAIIDGLDDALHGRAPRIDRELLETFLAELKERVEDGRIQRLLNANAEFRRLHDENMARYRDFHDVFASKEGVTTMPNGIQYQVLDTGAGPSPGPDDSVVVHYRIMDIDGSDVTEDTSVVEINDTVPGAQQLLQMMKVGDRWLVAIPPALAFGSRGRLPEIGPNQSVFGELTLLEIK